jgi:hypothetical protein
VSRTKLAVVIASVVVLVALYFYGKRLIFQTDWEYISSATSPDGAYTIKHYQSKSEAGHAPYGDNLVMESWRAFPSPNPGETFFAGYCGSDFKYEWGSNEKIRISCPSVTEQDPIRTQAIVVHGINVEVTK